MHDLMKVALDRAILAKAAHDEAVLRRLLGRWVSGLEPAVAYRNGEIIGLTVADAPIGSSPFLLEVEP